MEWSDIGRLIGKAAPVIGGILAGGIGPAIAGAAGLLGEALGCEPTPDAIHQAVLASPDAAVKLAEIEATNRERLAGITAEVEKAQLAAEVESLKAVNETMRAEQHAEHFIQWSWRPLNGYALAIGSLLSVLACGVLAFVAVFGRQPEAINMIPTLAAAFATVLAVPGAVCGVTAWHRGRAQVAQGR
jgi:roadblock/LC7 domain-containing protein